MFFQDQTREATIKALSLSINIENLVKVNNTFFSRDRYRSSFKVTAENSLCSFLEESLAIY